MSVNKTILIGNLGKDPETRTLDSGKSVCNFSIATSETYKKASGEKQTDTEWHNIVLWSPLAEIADKYLSKGSKVYIEGKLTHRSYESDGTTKYITEIIGRGLTMLDSKSNDKSNSSNQSSNQTSDDTDDLPF